MTTVKEKLHHLVDELDEDAAREALALLQDLRLPRAPRQVTSHSADEPHRVRTSPRRAERGTRGSGRATGIEAPAHG